MFKREYRINTERFLEVMKQGKRKSSPFALIYCLETGNKGRIAVSVPKKVEKTSVGRHRIKRLFTEALQKHGLPHADIVIVAKSGIDKLPWTKLVEEASHMLQ